MEFRVDNPEPGVRLDTWLHRRLPDRSRSLLSRWIGEGRVRVDGRRVKPRHHPVVGEVVRIECPDAPEKGLEGEAMDLSVLHEDEHLLVLDKPPGVCVHPSGGHERHTLVHGLLHHCKEGLSRGGEPERPGIVHRLDRDTSGCLLVAKTDMAHEALAAQFADRAIGKTYHAITCGIVRPPEGRIEARIERHPVRRERMRVTRESRGRIALTLYRTVEPLSGATLLEVDLRTGRTHQIRVHLEHLGHPVFGDAVYGRRASRALAGQAGFRPDRQLLHASILSFRHPVTGEAMRLRVALPPDMRRALDRLRTPRN